MKNKDGLAHVIKEFVNTLTKLEIIKWQLIIPYIYISENQFKHVPILN